MLQRTVQSTLYSILKWILTLLIGKWSLCLYLTCGGMSWQFLSQSQVLSHLSLNTLEHVVEFFQIRQRSGSLISYPHHYSTYQDLQMGLQRDPIQFLEGTIVDIYSSLLCFSSLISNVIDVQHIYETEKHRDEVIPEGSRSA